jgi:Copper fist DNA binding domain
VASLFLFYCILNFISFPAVPTSASCIKGHRSSSCHHTDRPLFEIKKKGRPASQCDKCRDLRSSKGMHVKCDCFNVPTPPASTSSIPLTPPLTTPTRRPGMSSVFWNMPEYETVSTARRHLPSTPTFPNGLKDLCSAETTKDLNTKQKGKRCLIREIPC